MAFQSPLGTNQQEQLTGTEEEAKRRVVILNLCSRHLTAPQQHAVAIGLFGEKAREEAMPDSKRPWKQAMKDIALAPRAAPVLRPGIETEHTHAHGGEGHRINLAAA